MLTRIWKNNGRRPENGVTRKEQLVARRGTAEQWYLVEENKHPRACNRNPWILVLKASSHLPEKISVSSASTESDLAHAVHVVPSHMLRRICISEQNQIPDMLNCTRIAQQLREGVPVIGMEVSPGVTNPLWHKKYERFRIPFCRLSYIFLGVIARKVINIILFSGSSYIRSKSREGEGSYEGKRPHGTRLLCNSLCLCCSKKFASLPCRQAS